MFLQNRFNMTTVNEDTGRILWSTESKYYLLRLIKENSVIISPDVSAETMIKKEEAWVGIEESFAADGMKCQLSKLKRLWKRMKDTARQNLIKYNEQKKKGCKSLKMPTELDVEVAEMIALRNLNKNNAKKNKSKLMYKIAPKPYESALRPLKRQVIIDDDENSGSYDAYRHQNNGYSDTDALEPVTILEELEQKPTIINVESYNGLSGSGGGGGGTVGREHMDHINIDDPEDSEHQQDSNDANTDCYNMQQQTSHLNTNATPAPDTETQSMQHLLLLQEIKLKELQRQNEEERMGYERELYQKKSMLLDLQIKKANLEIDTLVEK